MPTYSSNDVQIVDNVAPAYLKTLTDIANGDEISLSRFINPTQFAAIQAGSTTYNAFSDLSDAFTSGAKSLFAPKGVYRFSGDLPSLEKGMILRGAGSGEYAMQVDQSGWNTIFERQDAGTANSAVLKLDDGVTLETLMLRPANYQAVEYDMANYPTGTGNVGIGVWGGASCQYKHVVAMGFPISGFRLGTTNVAERSYAYMCDRGFDLDPNGATDGSLVNCIGMFCHHAGADLQNNFWSVLGGRWEWNARYGVILGAESTCTASLFDRNGFAGLYLASGQWGKAVSGNYFSRNGAGGNGTVGRWDFSTVGHQSYVAVPAGLSCHIQVDYEHAATVTGNRFRFGLDDGGGGSNAPQFNYGSATPSGATPTNGFSTIGNMGDRKTHAVLGYNTAYAGAGTGKPSGGTDTALNTYLNALT